MRTEIIPHADDDLVRIDAETLIPGRGQSIPRATLIINGSTIHHVGTTDSLPSRYKNVTPINVPVLMPGLWDCHVHYFGTSSYNVSAITAVVPALAGARSARDLAATINAGFTSVREMGGYGIQLAQAVDEGWLLGPNIYSAGSMLSPTAGHGDARDLGTVETLQSTMKLGDRAVPFYICDGVDECVKAVRAMTRRGASVIKIATSGGVASDDNPRHQKFSEDEIGAIVKEAGRADLLVAAHCHGAPGVRAALNAGCGTLEHGSWLCETKGGIEDMLHQGTILVATRAPLEFGKRHPEAWSKEAYQKLLVVEKANLKSYKAAIRSGVKVALGTDVGVSDENSAFQHGTNGIEFKFAVDAGLTPLKAIEAGTARGRETLGTAKAETIKKGELKAGWDADIIALSENPLDDIEVLANPDNVKYVWKGGNLVKKDGKLRSILGPF